MQFEVKPYGEDEYYVAAYGPYPKDQGKCSSINRLLLKPNSRMRTYDTREEAEDVRKILQQIIELP